MSRHPPMQRTGMPPAWATEWGQDASGVFVAFSVGEATQRLRWIAPGTFLMGSPEGEAGRFEHEGPQHEVTITRGFWLGETPVTQALWQGVMGRNPSRFVDPERPVERVSWEDIQPFLARVGAAVPGHRARLPTEAEWEYACRAGTQTATWRGDLVLLGDHNAPLLDAIAWYGGNSGQGFELQNGADSQGWPGKQYPHTRAGSHKVGQKQANPWGLHDLLGNVWEWCADGLAAYERAAAVDPAGSEAASLRVIRGGSWCNHARVVRAACRSGYSPGSRLDTLGFRLALQPAEP